MTIDVMESDGIRHFLPKSVRYYNPIVSDSKLLFRSNSTSLNNSTLTDGEIYCCVFFTFWKTITQWF